MIPEQIGVILTVTSALERLGVTYAIGGSFASAVHGVMRRISSFPNWSGIAWAARYQTVNGVMCWECSRCKGTASIWIIWVVWHES